MRTNALLISATMAAMVAAQQITDFVPECSHQCLTDAVASSTDCSLDDAQCQCTEENYLAIYGVASTCVIEACGNDVAVKEALPGGQEFCAQALEGDFINTADPPSANESEPTPTPSEEPSTDASATSEPTAETTGGSSEEPTGEPTADSESTPAPTPTSTGGAGKIFATALPLVGAVAAFVL